MFIFYSSGSECKGKERRKKLQWLFCENTLLLTDTEINMVFQEEYHVKNNKMYKMMIMGQIRLEQRNEQWS